MGRKAKIVATIGPSSQDEVIIERLLSSGMDVARLNFSHGTHQSHAVNILTLRKVAEQLGHPLAIMQDLQGPKIRVGKLTTPLSLSPEQIVFLFPEGVITPSVPAELTKIPVDFPQLFTSVKPGEHILLDDGMLSLSATQVTENQIVAIVENGGVLTSNKGINLPGVRLDIPAFTEKDAVDLKFGLDRQVDFVAISFVRKADDIRVVKEAISCHSPINCPLLIAKLERPEALDDLEAILEIVDGVMVARGDLGVEMAPEDVPGVQKRIILAANRSGKLVITATQMLESMIHNPLPTRAESSDVANAIFDGTDAVMLSGETAAGDFPVASVQFMDRIVRQAEAEFKTWGHLPDQKSAGTDDSVALTLAARELAQDQNVAAIAVFTRMGRSALLMAKARPNVPILAFTPEIHTYRRLAFAWGVQPYMVPFVNNVEEMIQCVEKELRESTKIDSGQQVVLICGFPIGEMRAPNMLLMHTFD
jgi:pyruvate kinase